MIKKKKKRTTHGIPGRSGGQGIKIANEVVRVGLIEKWRM